MSPCTFAKRLLTAVCAEHRPSLERSREWLVFAGQLEQAVHDADGHPAVAEVTGAAAALFLALRDGEPCGGQREDLVRALTRSMPHLGATELPMRMPEGFAWYALYPDSYARTALRWAGANPGRTAALIGLRSIGTSLSAVVAEQLRRIGHPVAGRLTLRPEGHPFHRMIRLPDVLPDAGVFILVDEGPGLSGSSMAGLADALATRGVAADAIVFFPGHGGGPGREAGEEQRQWWRSERCWFTPAEDLRAGPACTSAQHLFGGIAAACPSLATLASLKADRQSRRAEAGFALPCLARANGWLAIGTAGRPLKREDGTAAVFRHLASYIAHAATEGEPDGGPGRIADALIAWAAEALPGLSPDAIRDMADLARKDATTDLLHGDGRLAPEEWSRLEDGRILKRNATGTDLDHCWTGRQSVLWDVAAAAVEWQMGAHHLRAFRHDLAACASIECGHQALEFYRAGYCCLRLAQARLQNDAARALRYELDLKATMARLKGPPCRTA